MHQVLFPIDGSEYAKATMQWAARFLDNLDTSIHLLIVAESLEVDYSVEDMTRILNEAKDWFEACGFKVTHTSYLINKKAPDAICLYADQHQIDQIIIGSHGKNFAQMIIGSVSKQVMERAKQSVLVIKNTKIPELAVSNPSRFNLAQCPSSTQTLRILLPVDQPSTGEHIVNRAGKLLSGNTELWLLHVISTGDETMVESPMAAHERMRDAERLLRTNQNTLEKHGFKVAGAEYLIGSPAIKICQYANEKAVDQIMMASRNRSNIEKFLLGSVSADVISMAEQPVMVFGLGSQSVLSITHSDQVNLCQDTLS